MHNHPTLLYHQITILPHYHITALPYYRTTKSQYHNITILQYHNANKVFRYYTIMWPYYRITILPHYHTTWQRLITRIYLSLAFDWLNKLFRNNTKGLKGQKHKRYKQNLNCRIFNYHQIILFSCNLSINIISKSSQHHFLSSPTLRPITDGKFKFLTACYAFRLTSFWRFQLCRMSDEKPTAFVIILQISNNSTLLRCNAQKPPTWAIQYWKS